MMNKRLVVFLSLLTLASPAFAIGATIVAALVAEGILIAGSAAAIATAIAINMVVSAVVTYAFSQATQASNDLSSAGGNAAPDLGNRLQVSPATSNKLPVIYGTAYTGGIITDLSISNDNQILFYVIAICETTGTSTTDPVYFGNVYYGGKRCLFGSNGYNYNPIGQVIGVSSNAVTISTSEAIANGTEITFTGQSTRWVVASTYNNTAYDPETGSYYTVSVYVQFTTSITGASIGSEAYRATYYDNRYAVQGLLDESTGVVDYTVANKLNIFLYSNGSNSPANSSYSAIGVMQDPRLTYKWDSTKLMTNCVFAIVEMQYSVRANIRGINQTKFQIINSRTKPGDCIYDYMLNSRYGCGIPASEIDVTSLVNLNTYSDETVYYTSNTGVPSGQTRYRFDGQVDTNRNCMDTLQDMMNSCDSILKYNEIKGQWSVITNKPTYSVAMAINDSNMTSAITITPLDIAASYNYIEAKFPDKTNQDAFNTANFDLAQIAPTLLYPNEPVNKLSVSYPYVNNNVRAQILANRMIKACREDLQVTVSVQFQGLQLEAGDVVTVTSANYGWVDKLFRLIKVTETFGENGSVNVNLVMSEFNPTVYNDAAVTEFSPAPNTGISDPTFFGNVPAPIVNSQFPSASNPYFVVLPTCSDSGVVQYAEVWYSAYTNPLSSQRYFAGTTSVQSNGLPYTNGAALPLVSLSNIPAGNWYIFTRMVNNLASSSYSPPSALFQWRPTTFQYYNKYVCVAYGTSLTGAGFSFNPRGKTHYGLYNSDSTTPPNDPSLYTWFDATPDFGTQVYVLYSNRTGRKFSFASGFAAQAATTGAWVPTSTLIYDPSVWAALPDGTNYIDLDVRTGQLIQTGTTTVGTGEIAITNNLQGQVVAALQQYLNFGGAYSQTFSSGNLTVDIYGRVVGFEQPDAFYYSEQEFTATAGQTVFNVTRGSGYITGQCLVYQNGVLLNPSEYTDGATSVTFATGRIAGSLITIESFKSVSSVNLTTLSASGTGSVATLTFASRPTVPFTVGQSILVSGVTPSGYNGTKTVTACTNNSVSFASTATGAQTVAGTITLANINYPSFTRNSATLTNQGTYTASGFTLLSGYELLFLNGTILNSQDYDISNQTISFIGNATGDLQIIQWSANNLGVPNGTPVNIDALTTAGVYLYSFNYDANAFNVFENGIQLSQNTDFTTGTNVYTLVPTPSVSGNILVQQTFARTGAV